MGKSEGSTLENTTGKARPFHVQAAESGFEQLSGHLSKMMDELEKRSFFRSHAPDSWCPRLNVYETADRFLVCVELAGMPREGIDVQAVDGMLHIRGVRRKPALPEDADNVSVHLMEIDSGRFHRKVPIPSSVVVERISAAYRHGYLWVIMPLETGTARSGDR